MRSTIKAAVSALALLLALPHAAGAQDAAPEASAPPVALPDAPIPYTQIRPKAAPRRARPAPARATSAPAASVAASATTRSAVAGAAVALPGLPTEISGARLSAGQPIPPVELEAFVDGLVRDALATDHVAGAAVSVVQNGQIVLNKGYGFSRLSPQRPVDPNRTLFRIGSISKTFTWIALMKEVEAGRIRLNQPLNLYLPERVRVRDQGYDQDIRVINLLDHSAGFEDRALGHLFERDFERVRPLDLYLRQERPSRVRPAGAVATYSNYGAALAGQAVSYTSGKPFERLVEEEIFLPMAMRSTTFREPRPEKAGLPAPMPEALAADVSQGFRWRGGGFVPASYEFIGQIAPAGSASSTSADMARYMLLLLGDGSWNGVSIYGPQTARLFRTALRPTPRGVNGWAHGFATYDLPGGFRGYGHGGDTIAFHSNMIVIPALNLGIFVTTNTDGGHDLASRLPDRLVRQFYAGPMVFPRQGSPELAQRRNAFEGEYLSTGRSYSGLEGFVNRLLARARIAVSGEGKLLLTRQGETRAYVPEGDSADGRFVAVMGDERLAFRMQDGEAVGFHTATNASLFERIGPTREIGLLMTLAALTAIAAVATLGGIPLRNRREFRENAIQARASILQNIQAGLWLVALATFAAWALRASSDVEAVMYGWPGALPLIASACALVASLLSLLTLVALPAIWRGGRRVDSWPAARKLGFSLTVLIYAAFALTLALWGALAPWAG